MTINEVRNGDRVKVNDGSSVRHGIVYGKVSGKFGSWLRIKLEDDTFETCSGIVTQGIGVHYIGR